HPGGNRFGGLGPTHRIHRARRAGPLRDQHVPLPGPARRRPHHPRRPPTTTTHRHHLAVGRGDRDRLAKHPHRLRLNRHLTAPTTTKGARPWKPAQPGDTGRPNHAKPRKYRPHTRSRTTPKTTLTRTQNRG